MRSVSDKRRENQNTRCMFKKLFFPGNRAVYEIMWKNIEPSGLQRTIQGHRKRWTGFETAI